MRADIHPTWYSDAKVTCACGNSFATGSTLATIKVDICSKCHPLFTGQQKFIDTLGQVERFQQKTKIAEQRKLAREQILQKRSEKVKEEKKDKPSLRDLLIQTRKNLHS